ncbi:hypothetical protein [Roseomonas haemaphysalidis]|uniref:hypothetical protein n=1 Tax=Roseomonas haemaphysalidis TaxID=2768162 RepID=UPI001F329FD1|nr:hypothetical protein [Roseomonas haemaphysalidis]
MDRPTDNTGAADLDKLAEDWIALWQSELMALAADRETAEGWSALLSAWTAAAQGALRPPLAAGWPQPPGWPGMPPWPQSWAAAPFAMPPWSMPPPAPASPPTPPWPPAAAHEPAAAPPPGPAPAAAAPGAGDGARHGGDGGDPALRQRLDELERRLATLEAGPGGSGADRRRAGRRPPPA